MASESVVGAIKYEVAYGFDGYASAVRTCGGFSALDPEQCEVERCVIGSELCDQGSLAPRVVVNEF